MDIWVKLKKYYWFWEKNWTGC